mgnify:CR=1 FL=1
MFGTSGGSARANVVKVSNVNEAYDELAFEPHEEELLSRVAWHYYHDGLTQSEIGERLNLYQWIGVMLAVLSFFMLSRSGKKEGIDFKHNKWILFIVLAAVTGAVSGLYDKYLMKQLPPMVVQSWYNIYQVFIMCPIILLLWYPKRKESTPFRWDWTIIGISVFLCAADFVYFYALSYEDSMISIVSMVRRGSVVVSFLFGALFFREKNLKSKAVDLILVLIGMFFLYLGSK